MANKQPSDKEPYRTFLHFDKKLKDGETLKNIWNDIRHNYLTLKEWFADHDFYHKIGYLIASGSRTLQEMLNEYEGKSKSEFRAVIDGTIIIAQWSLCRSKIAPENVRNGSGPLYIT